MSVGDSVSDSLEEAIAVRLRQGYWVESQSESEARLIRRGRKRWFAVFGSRLPERREIVRVDSRGRTTVEVLPARRY
jgi:hypothetical protein